MEITALQIFGVILIYSGLHGFIKKEIKIQQIDNSGFKARLGPLEFGSQDRVISETVWKNKWVRPFCVLLIIIGVALIFFYPGSTIAITI